MSHAASTPRSGRSRRWRVGLLLGAALVLAVGTWLGLTARAAQVDLTAARQHAAAARTDLLAGDLEAASAQSALVASSAAAARADTTALPWRVLAAVPWAGRPVRAVQELVAVVDDLATQVLVPGTAAGRALDPATLRGPDGRVDLAALSAAQVPLRSVATAADALRTRLDAVPAVGVGAVDSARTELGTQLDALAPLLRSASTAADLLPPMLGAAGPRHYFLAFQTNAEARGDRGLVGAYGVLTAEDGTLRLDTLAANTALDDTGAAPVALGADFTRAYGQYASASTWANSNMSPSFPYAAQVWMSLWQQQTGQHLDGAVGADPEALALLLRATGAVTLPDGEKVGAGNVVRLTESAAYVRFPDNTQRKAYLQELARAVVERTLGGSGVPGTALLRALSAAVGQGRLSVYSAHPGEQQALAGTALGHAVPATSAPYAQVVVNNAAANKLDYYLDRSTTWTAGPCTGPTRPSTVTVRLRNTVTGDLPPYVAGRHDRGGSGPPGTNRLLVSLYATTGAQLRSVRVDGVAATAQVAAELGHPVYTADVQLPPGREVVLVFSLDEPSAPGTPTAPVQPLVRPGTSVVDVPRCDG